MLRMRRCSVVAGNHGAIARLAAVTSSMARASSSSLSTSKTSSDAAGVSSKAPSRSAGTGAVDNGSAAQPSVPPQAKKIRSPKFFTLVREKGLPYALYVLFVGEVLAWIVTYLLHYDILGAGDLISWLSCLGLGNVVDLEKQSERHVTVFGFPLSVRLGMNYVLASTAILPVTPVYMAFCAFTLPTVMKLCRPLKFWGKKGSSIPKAPPAAASPAPPTSLPK